MGTISARKRRDGSTGYTARVRIKRAGKIVHEETETFGRRTDASAWLKKREAALAEPGGLERAQVPDPALSVVIERYIADSEKEIGRTKAQVLSTIKKSNLGAIKCSEIGSAEIVSYVREIDASPQTRGNYVSHLSAVFSIAKPAWKYPLDEGAMDDAGKVLRKLGVIGKSNQRDRRPTLSELDKILRHFVEVRLRRPDSIPMAQIVAFAIFSTRRLDEITRITWDDFDEAHSRIYVRDMKHPGQKVGNNVWCDLTPEAVRLIKASPRTDEQIFPFNGDSISTNFTRAVAFLGIDDLHFHDLRHEGVSRLFEMGRTIPLAAAVSGHRSWQSLQRYTHIKQAGDKYEGWKWIRLLAPQNV